MSYGPDMVTSVDAYESAKYLNNKLADANPSWRGLDLWDDDLGRPELHLHKLLSSLLAVLRGEEVVWADVQLDLGEDTPETTGYTVTIWTGSLVVRATRAGGDQWPLVSVTPRSALTCVEVLRMPVDTTSDHAATGYRSTSIRLSYPKYSIDVQDPRGDRLRELLPGFIADLE